MGLSLYPLVPAPLPTARVHPCRGWTIGGALYLSLLLSGCTKEPEDMFIDAALASGIDFHHFNGMSGEFYFCEVVGAGCALFDYDNDGDLDVFFGQGKMLGPKTLEHAKFPAQPNQLPLRGRLYRNDLNPTGKLHFVDVTAASKIVAECYSMGMITGDYDSDGDVDLYLTGYDGTQFWSNNGDGTFTDVTAITRTGERRWSTSAAFLDFDADGGLDLFVCTYVNFSTDSNKPCFDTTSARDYCGPKSFQPYPHRLFRNKRDGTFEDVSVATGIASASGPGLGVVGADFNQDGLLEIFVANDGAENFLWVNQKNGMFKNMGRAAGVSLNRDGVAEANMGVDAADFDCDGDLDIFITHLREETNILYGNMGNLSFEDRTVPSGLGVTRTFTGFGTGAFDYDNDGLEDILAVNGDVRTIEKLARMGDPFPLDQQSQLYHNVGRGRFELVTASAGKVFELEAVGRGAAFGDIDNDGDLDAMITNNQGPARLLLNMVGNKSPWIAFRVRDEQDRFDLLGSLVEVRTADGRVLIRRVRTDVSYCCGSDPRVHVGLGANDKITSVRVRYVGGGVEEWTGLESRRLHTLRRGTGRQ